MDFTSKLRAAFLTSIADLFFGAASILLILIVMAKPADETRTQRFVDRQLWCDRQGDTWRISAMQGPPNWTISEWLERETGGALLVRVGLWVKRDEVDCFRAFEESARKHNSQLTQRGKVSGSVATVMLPGTGGRTARVGAKP